VRDTRLKPPATVPDALVGKFNPRPLAADNVQATIGTLAEWVKYATRANVEANQILAELRLVRIRLKSAYHEDVNAAFRTDYKAASSLSKLIGSAEEECGKVHKRIADATDKAYLMQSFVLFFVAGQLQAVVEWGAGGAASRISNIVSDPRNVMPERGQTPVKGVAKAVIGLTILRNKQQAGANHKAVPAIKLYALSNIVKDIYERYYFKVTKAGAFVERPWKRGQGKKGEGTTGLPSSVKTEWHEAGDMVLTPERAEEFLRKEHLKDVLEVPADLRAFLPT
jgi:hypothetical protein